MSLFEQLATLVISLTLPSARGDVDSARSVEIFLKYSKLKNKAATTKKCETKSNTSEVSTHPHDRQEAEDSSGPILHAKLFMCRAVACNKGMQCGRARWSADKMRRVCDLNAR